MLDVDLGAPIPKAYLISNCLMAFVLALSILPFMLTAPTFPTVPTFEVVYEFKAAISTCLRRVIIDGCLSVMERSNYLLLW